MKTKTANSIFGEALTILGFVNILIWSPVSSAAVINTFTNASAWTTAAGGTVVNEDFTDATLVPGLSIPSLGGGSIGGGMINNALAVFGLCIDGGVGCPSTTVFNFSPGTTAFGLDWDLSPGGAGSGIYFSVGFAGGGSQIVSPGIVNPAGGTFNGFFGFTSDVSITSIRLGSGFTGSGETFNADNLRFATNNNNNNNVPEPATIILLSLGLIGLVASRKHKQS